MRTRNCFLILLMLLVCLFSGCQTMGNSTSKDVWIPLIEGSDITYNKSRYDRTLAKSRSMDLEVSLLSGSTYVEREYTDLNLSNGKIIPGDRWYLFEKDIVESYPQENRTLLVEMFSRYYWGWDKVDKEIEFEPLRYVSGPYSSQSHIGIVGTIKDDVVSASLKLYYHSSDWLFIERAKFVVDDYTETIRIGFDRGHYTDIWEYAYLDLSDAKIYDLLKRIINSEETIIRYYGKQYYDDVEVPQWMKEDLRIVLEGLELLGFQHE